MITFKMFLEGKGPSNIIMLKGGYYLERDSASSHMTHSWFIKRLMDDEIFGNAKQRKKRSHPESSFEWSINIPQLNAFNEMHVEEDEAFDNAEFKAWVIDQLSVLRMFQQ